MAENENEEVFGDEQQEVKDDLDVLLEKNLDEDTPPAEEKPEAEPKEEADPKDAVIGEFRRDNREMRERLGKIEAENVELKQKLESQVQPQQKEESPLEKAEKAYKDEYGNLDGFNVSGDLYRQQRAWEKDQEAKATETEQQKKVVQQTNLDAADLNKPSMKEAGVDAETVLRFANRFLTDGDRLDIRNAGPDMFKKAYSTALMRLSHSDDPEAQKMMNRIKTYQSSQDKPKNEPPKKDNENETGDEELDYGASDQTKRLAGFIFET